MRAHELIFDEEGRIIGNSEIDINSILRVENGWMQGDVFIPNSKILISLNEELY